MPLVSVAVMSFNSRKYYGKRYDEISRYLEVCLESIKKQDYKNIEISVFDDCSEEDPSEKIKKSFPDVKIFRNKENIGLLKTENKAIRQSHGKYILILNQDIYLENDYVSKLVEVMEDDETIGVSIGKIKRFFIDNNLSVRFTNVLDSVGLQFPRDRNIIDRGQLEKDSGQYDKSGFVFGVTGAAPFYSKKILEETAINGEYYDEDFWMYKEDPDLCWRMNIQGSKCFYCADTIAYHARSSGGISKDDREKFFRRRISIVISRIFRSGSGSIATRRRSYSNHYFMLIKNDTLSMLAKSIIPFGWLEFQKFVFGTFFEPRAFFPSWVDFFGKLAKIKKKRKIIQSRRKVSPKELEELFCRSIW